MGKSPPGRRGQGESPTDWRERGTDTHTQLSPHGHEGHHDARPGNPGSVATCWGSPGETQWVPKEGEGRANDLGGATANGHSQWLAAPQLHLPPNRPPQ